MEASEKNYVNGFLGTFFKMAAIFSEFSISLLLGEIQLQYWCLYIHFGGQGIQCKHLQNPQALYFQET